MATKSALEENRTRTLLRGIRHSGLCVIYYDAKLAVRLVENSPPSWPPPESLPARGTSPISL